MEPTQITSPVEDMPGRLLGAIKPDADYARSSVVLNPWSLDGGTVATDGKMIVWANVPSEHPPMPDVFTATARRVLSADMPTTGKVTVAVLKAWAGEAPVSKAEACPKCNGAKRIKCDECRGTGRTSCRECGERRACDCQDGTATCKLCDGDGTLSPAIPARPGIVAGCDYPFNLNLVAALAAMLPDADPPVTVQAGRPSSPTAAGEHILRLMGPGWVFALMCLATKASDAPALAMEAEHAAPPSP